MSESHPRYECIHGTVVMQCRCTKPHKKVVIVECPDDCPAGRG